MSSSDRPVLAAPPNEASYGFSGQLLQAATRKSERTRASLQAAACCLLDTAPPSELKVSDVCREAKVAHGTFYVYFRDIRHMLGETLLEFVAFMQTVMRRAGNLEEGSGRARRATAAYVWMFEQNAGLMRCLVSRVDDLPEAADAFQRLNREWAETVVESRLRRLAREGWPGSISREELLRRAYALGGMVDQYLIMLLFGSDETLAAVSQDRDALVETLTLIWERGMDA
jgi:TetR/AcrR family transcriptional regulator, ethionamide resistance regulator